ncbi:MAG: hypothetical protein DYG93_06165 [Leptolyngbya sp. PLA2]|nr:hypothetical protein [Leptolyngbya sp.]MCE7971233.1 hypothetical protein [Leptolyngbya sp. PL-A2]MCQ3939591.1 hypothetical protein [cyanobacterium CYA1]MCZ7632167.1 hypothetical protein [Phycisphaerales bacterium]MDL1903847.1 hypothetical protein [Synechococcales cyanobacterium CNB]GIK18560.1 MAG: hypothetical protein BroJett004_07240 [Planctomycetota bacterium]
MMKTSCLAGVFAAAGFAFAASADVVEMKFTGTGQGRNVKVTIGDKSMSVFAGQLKHSILSGTGLGADLVGDHLTYCTDLYEYVKSSPTTYTVVTIPDMPDSSPMGFARAGGVYDLFNWAGGQQFDTGVSKDFAAAFQIAVWEVVTDYDPAIGRASLDVTAGELKVKDTGGGPLSSGISGHLVAMFDAVGSDSARRGLVGLRSFGAQDQITVIPAPGPLTLAAGGLLLAVPRRRSR